MNVIVCRRLGPDDKTETGGDVQERSKRLTLNAVELMRAWSGTKDNEFSDQTGQGQEEMTQSITTKRIHFDDEEFNNRLQSNNDESNSPATSPIQDNNESTFGRLTRGLRGREIAMKMI